MLAALVLDKTIRASPAWHRLLTCAPYACYVLWGGRHAALTLPCAASAA